MIEKASIRKLALTSILLTGGLGACADEKLPQPIQIQSEEKPINPPEPTSLVYIVEPTLTPKPEPLKIPFLNNVGFQDGDDGGGVANLQEGPISTIGISEQIAIKKQAGENSIGNFSENWITKDGVVDLSKPANQDVLLGKERAISLPKDNFLVIEAKSLGIAFGGETAKHYISLYIPDEVDKTNLIIVKGKTEDTITIFSEYTQNSPIRIYNAENNSLINEASFDKFMENKKSVITLFDLENEAITVLSSDKKLIASNIK